MTLMWRHCNGARWTAYEYMSSPLIHENNAKSYTTMEENYTHGNECARLQNDFSYWLVEGMNNS